MNSFFQKAFLLLAVVGGLAGCGKVLDWRNAEVSNGKIYERGANQPFSGKVTNIPQEKISPRNEGWMTAIRPVINVRGMRSSGSMCDAKLDDGLFDGEMLCTSYDSKQLQYQVTYKAGALDGKFTLFNIEGTKKPLVTANFVNGQIDGTQKVFSPKNEQLLLQAEWDQGKPTGEQAQFDEETGKKTSSQTYKNNLPEGDIYQWASDGKTVLVHATARKGKLEGLREEFFPDGKKKSESSYQNGQLHGIKKIWDEEGKLKDHARYANDIRTEDLSLTAGNPVPALSSVDLNVCLNKWTTAHRQVVGPDAMIKADQIEEWLDWCRSGKVPN